MQQFLDKPTRFPVLPFYFGDDLSDEAAFESIGEGHIYPCWRGASHPRALLSPRSSSSRGRTLQTGGSLKLTHRQIP